MKARRKTGLNSTENPVKDEMTLESAITFPV